MTLLRPPSLVQCTTIALCATLLTACGGDSPDLNVQVEVTSPTGQSLSQAPVFELQTPLQVRAHITIDALPAQEAVSVNFSSSAGLLSPATATTHNGQAKSVLIGTVPGEHTLRADINLEGMHAGATQTIYLRQPAKPLELLVPAYFFPTTATNAGWNLLAASAAANPGLQITAILNPSNGIFTTANPAYLQAAQKFVNAGGKILGYVHTSYGTGERPLAEVKTNVDRYLTLYGRNLISGIFLDEMSNKTTTLSFYQPLYRYIKAKDPSLRVVGNPGTVPANGMTAVSDALVTFEGKASDFSSYDPRNTGGWLYTLSNDRQGVLIHNASNCAAMQTAIARAATAHINSGLVYATDRKYNYTTDTGNPWSNLPTYWNSLVTTVNAINQGRPLPAC